MRSTVALVAILVLVLIGSAAVVRSKNHRIAYLEQQAATANEAVESQQGAVLTAQMRLASFKEELAREHARTCSRT